MKEPDALCLRLVKQPEAVDVLVFPNQYGDIVSDLCGGIAGSLGLAPGANIGKGVSVFEASHGAAADIAGQGIANPVDFYERIPMQVTSNTVLITGGASGIGFALAERFLKAGNEVIVCGRRRDRLQAAQAKHARLTIRVCDVAKESDRLALCQWAVGEFPALNVLVNNAGIQRRLPLTPPEAWELTHQEIAVNFEAPVHLTTLLVPHLLTQPRPAIVNVTSGLGFVPMARTPIYCATKAALHSFTMSLRHQLSHTPIQVIEIIPPAVNTDLGGPGLHTYGVPLDEFADAAFAQMQSGELEITYGFSREASGASREQLDAIFNRMNRSVS